MRMKSIKWTLMLGTVAGLVVWRRHAQGDKIIV